MISLVEAVRPSLGDSLAWGERVVGLREAGVDSPGECCGLGGVAELLAAGLELT